ncbi:MAG: hypothetical protein Q8L52_02820 [bacterium]|nr:hypothetical protein [bacterium]
MAKKWHPVLFSESTVGSLAEVTARYLNSRKIMPADVVVVSTGRGEGFNYRPYFWSTLLVYMEKEV